MDIGMSFSENVCEKDERLDLLSLNQKIEELESLKRVVDGEIKEIETQLKDVMIALVRHGSKKPKESNESVDRLYHARVKKAMTTSLVLSLTSIPLAFHSKSGSISKKIFPWSIAIGLGSLACSCYFMKDVYDNFEYSSRQLPEFPWMETEFPILPQIPKVHVLMRSPMKLQRIPEYKCKIKGRLSPDGYLTMNFDESVIKQSRKRFKTA